MEHRQRTIVARGLSFTKYEVKTKCVEDSEACKWSVAPAFDESYVTGNLTNQEFPAVLHTARLS